MDWFLCDNSLRHKGLNKYISIFENVMLMGDFNFDFKKKKDSNFEKLNKFYDTFSLLNLRPWT